MSDYIYANGELYHYGVKGMKWGVRRYQNKDGSLTDTGKRRAINREAKQYRKELYKEHNLTRKLAKEESSNWKKGRLEEAGIKDTTMTDQQKKMIKAGAAVAGAALVAYGGYKLYESGKLDDLISKGSAETDTLMNSFGSTKTADINRINIDRASVTRATVNKSRIKIDDLSEGTRLIKKMQSDGTNITKELRNNQWMSKDMDELAEFINNMKKVNAMKKNRGMPVDDSVLSKMELAYIAKRYAEIHR